MTLGRQYRAHGEGAVPRPSAATAYRRLAQLANGTNAVSGSAKGRRSIADRPEGAYGRLRAARPGEYAVLDTQDLDVFAMEPVTCRWVRAPEVGHDVSLPLSQARPVCAEAGELVSCWAERLRAAGR